jgi:hypothetical protein
VADDRAVPVPGNDAVGEDRGVDGVETHHPTGVQQGSELFVEVAPRGQRLELGRRRLSGSESM